MRSGDVVRAKECMNELSLTGKPGILSLNPLRHAQNLFIAHITQITRAAMEAGVEEDMTYAMSDTPLSHTFSPCGIRPPENLRLPRQARAIIFLSLKNIRA